MSEGVDFKTTTAKAMFDKHGIDDNTIAFTGHALALYRDDKYVPCMCACLLCLTAVPAGTHDCYSTCTGCFGFAFCPYLVPVLSLIVMNTTSLIKWA